MVTQLYEKSYSRPNSRLSRGYYRLESESVSDENGRFSSKPVTKYFDTQEQNKQFKSYDFSLSSILAVGAYDMLKPVVQSRMNDMDLADKFDNLLIQNPS